MNVKSLLLLLALTGLGAGCTDDVEGGGSQTSGTRSEIQIELKGASESEEYSKAIASESENRIKDLKIYLFAAAAQSGPYYYLETWTEGTAYDPANPSVTNFQRQEAGTSLKASIYPNELKGLPYMQLMCIANNNGTVSSTLDGKFYQVDGATELPALVPVTVNLDGTIANAGAATKADAFQAAFTRKMLNTDAQKDIIGTPLLMSGDGQTKISGSVSKVNITMRRAMARFDIDNTKSKSNLTILTVTLANGRPTSSIWNATPQAVANPTTDLMTYAPISYTAKDNANQGMTESAIYVYPGLKTDESYLIVTGTYKSPVTTLDVPVTYNIPIQRTVADRTEYIDIKANSRYKLKITDVTQAAIYGTFEVEDWTSGGGIQIKPDNDAPLFDPATGFAAETGAAPAAIGESKTMFVVEESSVFTTTIAATGKVRAEKAVATKTVSPDWLTIEAPVYTEKDGVWYSAFKMTVNRATGELPVAVTFINEAASYDPDLWTVLTLYGPKAKPSLENGGEGSLGNTVDYTALTANMYNVVGSTIKVKAMCIEGTTLNLPTEFEEVEADRVTEGYYTTFTIRVKSALTDGNEYPLEFQNAEDAATKTTLTVTAVKAGLSASLDADASTYADLAGTTVKTDIDLLSTNSYTLLIAAPQGADVTLPSGKWLTVEVNAAKTTAGVLAYTVKRNASVTDYADFDLVFTNKLNPSETLTVTMNKAFSKPIFAAATAGSKSDFNDAPVITDYAPTAKMFLANGSKIAIKVTCPETMTFLEQTTSGLTITDKGEGNYELEVNDATAFTAGSTTTVVAQNTTTGADDRNATLTITWVSPAIAVTLTDNNTGNVVETAEGDKTIYTVDVANLSNFTFTVNAAGGATTDLSVLTGTFLKKHAENTGDNTLAKGVDEVYKLRVDDDTQSADITMTFTNAITNGGNKTIVFKKKP